MKPVAVHPITRSFSAHGGRVLITNSISLLRRRRHFLHSEALTQFPAGESYTSQEEEEEEEEEEKEEATRRRRRRRGGGGVLGLQREGSGGGGGGGGREATNTTFFSSSFEEGGGRTEEDASHAMRVEGRWGEGESVSRSGGRRSVGRSVGLSGCYWARSEAGRREEYVLLCTKVNTNLILCTSPPLLNTE